MQKPINRRAATAAIGAAAVAMPIAALAGRAGTDAHNSDSTVRISGDDPLLAAIEHYRAEMAAINASGDLSDEEINAWVDRADRILKKAMKLPVLTTASAVAVIDLLLAERLIASHSIYGPEYVALAKSARNYIAATVRL